MAEVTCPQCRQTAKLLFCTRDFNRKVSDEPFEYFRCPACHLVFLEPIPAELSRYYTFKYYEIPESTEAFESMVLREKKKLDLLRRFVSGGRMLEVGAGYGAFSLLARRAGFEVEVIEQDPACCQFLEQAVGLRVHASDKPMDVVRSLGGFDAIALWQVIEHLPNPWETLDMLAGHLMPGGVLIIATPNPESIQFRLFQGRWAHVDAPRHLQLIPCRLLLQRAERSGLQSALATADFGNLRHDKFGWQGSLRNLLPQRFAGLQAMRFLTRALGLLVSRLLRPIERAGFRGTTYTVVF